MEKRFKEGFLLKRCDCDGFLGNAKEYSLMVFERLRRIFDRKSACSGDFESAKRHLSRYLNDLKLHFDLTDDGIQKISMETYNSNKPQNPIVKCLTMLKYWN